MYHNVGNCCCSVVREMFSWVNIMSVLLNTSALTMFSCITVTAVMFVSDGSPVAGLIMWCHFLPLASHECFALLLVATPVFVTDSMAGGVELILYGFSTPTVHGLLFGMTPCRYMSPPALMKKLFVCGLLFLWVVV